MTQLSENLQKLDGFLARFRDTGILNQIGGEAVPAASGQWFDTLSPTDGSVICQVARGAAEDIDRAAAAARRPFRPGVIWAGASGAKSCTGWLMRLSRGLRKSPCARHGTVASRCALCPKLPCAGQKISAFLQIKPPLPAMARPCQLAG